MPRRNPLQIVGVVATLVVAVISFTGLAGCDAPSRTQDDLVDLRDWALDETVPRDERVHVLLQMLANHEEDVEARATAAQMLGRLHERDAIPLMIEALGGGDGVAPQASKSERLRMECVIALGRFAEPEIYRETFELVYVDRREVSQIVRRMFIQSFENVAVADLTNARIQKLADQADVLRHVMVKARDGGEDRSIVWCALKELRRICNRPDLDVTDDDQWKTVIVDLRAGIRAGNEN